MIRVAFALHKSPAMKQVFSDLYMRTLNSDMLSHLPKVTQPTKDKADTSAWVYGFLDPSFPLSPHHVTLSLHPQSPPCGPKRHFTGEWSSPWCPTGSAGSDAGNRGVGTAPTHGPSSLRWVPATSLEINKALSSRCRGVTAP